MRDQDGCSFLPAAPLLVSLHKLVCLFYFFVPVSQLCVWVTCITCAEQLIVMWQIWIVLNWKDSCRINNESFFQGLIWTIIFNQFMLNCCSPVLNMNMGTPSIPLSTLLDYFQLLCNGSDTCFLVFFISLFTRLCCCFEWDIGSPWVTVQGKMCFTRRIITKPMPLACS